jgi:IPT/TIG domain
MPQARDDNDKKPGQPPQGAFNQVGQGGQGPGQFDQHGNLIEQKDQSKALRPGQTESLATQEREQAQKRQQDAWEEAARREKDNNPATKDRRGAWYTKENQPGLHPANQPDPDSKLNKGTRLDLEDLTGNPGHRGVNPDAPANSINKPTDPKTGRLESINEPPDIEQNWPKAGQRSGKEVPAGGSEWSINEPPGSQVIPEGAGEGSGGGQVKTLRLDSINPTETQFVEGVDTLTLTATGQGFDDQCVIVFDGEDQDTEFVSETELRASVPYAEDPGEVEVMVSKGDEDSQALQFTFTDPPARSSDDERDRGRRRR